MLRLLLIVTAAAVIAAPGVVSVATNASTVPVAASAPTPVLRTPPSATPSVTPSVSPSPGDVTPPVTTATGMGSTWRRTAATVRFEAHDADSGVAATIFSVDSGAWRIGDQVTIRAPKDHSNDGKHVITFYSVDNALVAEAWQTVTVKIDTRPPHFQWRSVRPGVIYRIQGVTLRFNITEMSGPVRLSYRVNDQYGYFAARKRGLERSPGLRSLVVPTRYGNHRGFVPGVYRLQLTLTDAAGNVTVTNRRTFRDYRPMAARAWYRVRGAGRRVALTFDDGGAGPWQSMLNTLKRYHSHATFFPLGPYAAASPSLMRRTVREGSAVGTHGWTHTDMTRQSYSQIRSEWSRGIAPWWSATGYSPVPYCRPPYGSKNSTTLAASGSLGFYRVILWDVDPRDWTSPGSGVIASRVLSHVHPGAIVCMHLRGQTAAALPAILRGLHARGYKAVSLPELFHAAGMR